jgi:hypothetical protein
MKPIFILFFVLFSTFLFSNSTEIFRFSEPDKYGWTNPELRIKAREDLYNRQKLLQIYHLNKQNPTKNVIKTMILPGWGHFSAHRYTKGQVLLGMEIILLGSSIYFYDQAKEYYDKYKQSTNILDINNFYEDTKIPLRLSQGFLTLGILVWIYSLYDTPKVTDEYNKDLWDKLIFEFHQKRVEVTPHGVTLRF